MTKAERQALWKTRIAEYQASGQSVKEWCASHEDVSPKQLWYWLRKYKNRNGVTPGKSNRWLPVEVSEFHKTGSYFTDQCRIGQHRGKTRF
ncbi:IS66 family insertion sequence element accessory protein TnpA [Moorella sulfitireducens]|uniref:IS66 family insertion sequence element accessory protein TnpA n=1 Tax=Neomoorella sulfitireducens TaxID=2972948 RepID=UPI0021ACAB30|nr:transposase [Moorella sulfitireducens]